MMKHLHTSKSLCCLLSKFFLPLFQYHISVFVFFGLMRLLLLFFSYLEFVVFRCDC